MTRKHFIIVLLLFAGVFSGRQTVGQSISSYPNATTYLNYFTYSDFINGVSSTTLTITLNNLNNSTNYNLYFRSQNGSFTATNPAGTIPLSGATFTCLNIVNSSSSSSGKAPTNITLANNVALTYYNSFSTSAPILVSFRTGSNHSGSDVLTITFKITGPTDLSVPGNTTINGNTYGPVTLRYDIYRVSNANVSSSGSNHKLAIRVKDAISFVVNSPTTTLLVNTASALANGFTQVAENQITISSNEPFNLKVRASGSDFTASGTLDKIPTSYMQLKINNTNTTGWTISGFTALNGTTAVTLASIIPRDNNINISIAYKLTPTVSLASKTPALYTTTLTYTATQN